MSDRSKFAWRESFLMGLLHGIIREYQALWEIVRGTKPFKISEILIFSSIPGETKFSIQLTNKNCVVNLTAAEIINSNYNLEDFSAFHAEMIRQAAQGKLMEFLKISEGEPLYKIISKKLDRKTQQYIFTLTTKDNQRLHRTAAQLSHDKKLLNNMNFNDIYDIGHTQGIESILHEKMELFLAKNKVFPSQKTPEINSEV